jgi:hypothetical protein
MLKWKALHVNKETECGKYGNGIREKGGKKIKVRNE